PLRVTDALSHGYRRYLDPLRQAVIEKPGRPAAPLPELIEVVEGQVEAREVERAVQQHARVTTGQDEPVAVRPVWVRGVVAQVLLPQHPGERRERHGRPGMAGVRLLHRVHGEGADGVDAELLEIGVAGRGGGGPAPAPGPSSPDLGASHRVPRGL